MLGVSLLLSLSGCGDELRVTPSMRTDAAARAALPAPSRCELLTRAPIGGPLNASTVMRSVEEVREPVERALCDCAAPSGLAAPADLNVMVTHFPLNGTIERVTVDLRDGDFSRFDWAGYERCVDTLARRAELPRWPLGSCVVPSRGDSRLSLGMPVSIR